jgi:hypothetical protein
LRLSSHLSLCLRGVAPRLLPVATDPSKTEATIFLGDMSNQFYGPAIYGADISVLCSSLIWGTPVCYFSSIAPVTGSQFT